jgi:hypothetical protein
MSDETNAQEINVSRRGLFHILGVAGASAALAELPAQAQQTNEGSASPKPAVKPVKKPQQFRVFDAHQQKTAAVLSDLILPADERGPAASATDVVPFMDDWIAFRAEQDGYDRLKAEILGGMVWLDRESNNLFQSDFVDAKTDQQKQILDRIAYPDRAAAEDRRWADFFTSFRDLVVAGYFSSKEGVADLPYLGNTVVTHWIGCEPKVWAIIEDRLNSGYTGLINPSNQNQNA